MAHQQVSAELAWGPGLCGSPRPAERGRQAWIFTLHVRRCPGSFCQAKLVAEFRRCWLQAESCCTLT